MLKHLLATLAIILTLAASCYAKIYRCTLLDGKVVYGDKPVYVSDEYCQEVKESGPQDVYSKPPEKRRNSNETQVNRASNKPKPTPKEVRSQTSPSSYRATKDKATSLIERYKEARRKRYLESYLINKQKAVREIKAVKQEKRALLKELGQSSMNAQGQDEIRMILEEIPE